jgi:uncharacterized protein YheU (UPF0270 family)
MGEISSVNGTDDGRVEERERLKLSERVYDVTTANLEGMAVIEARVDERS